jgi:hypothetical protein
VAALGRPYVSGEIGVPGQKPSHGGSVLFGGAQQQYTRVQGVPIEWPRWGLRRQGGRVEATVCEGQVSAPEHKPSRMAQFLFGGA